MSRATNAVARKRRKKKVLKQAKGYWGRKHSSYRFANEQVMRSGQLRLPRPAGPQARDAPALDHPDQRRRAARGHELLASSSTASTRPGSRSTARCSPTSPSAIPRRSADLPSKPGRPWRPERRPPHQTSPGAPRGALFCSTPSEHMITSQDNEKLKLIRKLAERKHREREGLFAAEGEDLVAAAAAAGARARVRAPSPARTSSPRCSTRSATLGSGTRVIGVYRAASGPRRRGRLCVYLHGVGDPGNVGTIIRTAHALADGPGRRSGPGCADPFAPKAVRASMGSIFARPPLRGRRSTTLAAPRGRPRRARRRAARRRAGRRRSASAASARACRPSSRRRLRRGCGRSRCDPGPSR